MRAVAKSVLACWLALGGLVASGPPVGSAQAAVQAVPQATLVTAAGVSPTALRVDWVATTDANTWWVIVTSPNDRSVGQRTACGTCRSIVVDHLAPGSNYFVRVVAVDEASAFGPFAIAVGTTPPAAGCELTPSGSVCATVDTRAAAGDATGAGVGSLHGIDALTADARVAAIDPSAWRLAALDYERFHEARTHGGAITLILSDPWMNATQKQAPWANWDFYEWWIGAVVDGHILRGAVPEYWEVQNEPSPSDYVGGDPATPELVFEQHRRAAAVIRTRLPDAAVIGPSSGYVRFGSGFDDAQGFLERAAATGMDLSGLSWHEIGASCLGWCDGGPRAVLQHADDARAAIAAAGLRDVELHVNEWGAPWNFRQPGAAVGYLSSLAYAGIDIANPACWDTAETGTSLSTCFARPGMLDGLLLADGATPTDAFHAHETYADMTGPEFSLVESTIADAEASVLSTVDPAGVIRVLIGRHTGCQTDLDEHCPGLAYAAARAVRTVLLTAAADGTSYTATVERIPSVAGALAAPTLLATRTLGVAGGRLDVGSYTMGDGSALSITLVPTGAPIAPTTTATTTGPTTTVPPTTAPPTTAPPTTASPTTVTPTTAPTTTTTRRARR